MGDHAQKILILYWGRRGGGAQCFSMLLKALKTRPGIELHCSYSLAAENRDEIESLNLPSLPIETYTNISTGLWQTLRIARLRKRLAKYLHDNRIDAAVSVMPHLWSWLIADVFKKNDVVYFPVIHDASPHPGDVTLLWRTRMKADLSQATRVFTFSNYVSTSIAQEYGVHPDRIISLQLGPTTLPAKEIPIRRYPRDRIFRIIFLGRLRAYKGLDVLVSAFNRLKERNIDAELWIVGEGDLGIEVPSAIAPFVHIERRWLSDTEISDYMLFGDLLVLPYVEASQSGLVAAAQSHGLPVVATPVGGLRDQVSEKSGGLLATSKTAADLADLIEKVVARPEIYDTLAANAHMASRNNAVWTHTATEILRALPGSK